MAIVNVTPDSFYDSGETFSTRAALAAAERALDDGADIIDIGGVKAGQAGAPVSSQEELDRVAPVVAGLRERRPDAVISVDTWRAGVAESLVSLGADLINDAWEQAEPAIASVAGRTGAGLVCTHAGHLPPRTDPQQPVYEDVVLDVVETCTRLAITALDAGARPDGLLVDPGHDFGKTTVHSLEITRRLPELVATGWPVLVALSNKDFVGESLDLPVGERLYGSLAAVAVSASLGARVFRVHNVRETRQVLDMVATIRGDRPPALSERGR